MTPRQPSIPDPVQRPAQPVSIMAREQDILDVLAERVLTRHAAQLPHLQHVRILLPHVQAAPRLRRLLLIKARQRGHDALLGPHIDSLRSWLSHAVPLAEPPIDDHSRRLLLVEALQTHAGLFGEHDPWRLSESLATLFDELGLHQIAIPEDLATWTTTLARAYGIAASAPAYLSQEARIVHHLWRAWREQLAANGQVDAAQAYLSQLQSARQAAADTSYFYLAGYTRLAAAELDWLRPLLVAGRAELLLQGQTDTGLGEPLLAHLPGDGAAPTTATTTKHAATAYGRWTDAVFESDAPLRARARAFAAALPDSPARGRLSILAARDAEQEAQAVDLQVRRWLLAGRRQIAVVTEDRRLARRIRALLERADVLLVDHAGWALSTTSAAAAVERWLQALEEDFAHQPLMDLLKSPFLAAQQDDDAFLHTVYRFEQDIILHENIPRGLQRYRDHIRYRRARLPWSQDQAQRLLHLLDLLDSAAAPLRALHRGQAPARCDQYLQALSTSLEQLGLADGLQTDPAGAQLVAELARMTAAAQGASLRLSWQDFRTWLAQSLEHAYFRPPASRGAVQLFNLQQSTLGRFDGLIIAGAEQQFLPGNAALSPYFNEGVRRELGLPAWQASVEERLHQFRCLLHAAPQVLISHRREQDGEPIVPSPWLTALRNFHQLAYGDGLAADDLAALAHDPRCHVIRAEHRDRPAPQGRPRPHLPAELSRQLVPGQLTSGAHQRLIDCPYLFFSADCLRLKPLDRIREALEKSDYGERVHRCLQAFHSDVENLPGPFTEPLSDTNRQRALACMTDIANAEFGRDLEDNVQHRAWLKRWLDTVPLYLAWQTQRQSQWRVRETEAARSTALHDSVHITGRLDRIDQGTDGVAIVDYKTGATPKIASVQTGEAVQLPTYALLAPGTTRVEYLSLARDKVSSAVSLEHDELRSLCTQVAARLLAIVQALHQETPLPAWGDAATCQYCPMDGVCRKQSWLEDDIETPN